MGYVYFFHAEDTEIVPAHVHLLSDLSNAGGGAARVEPQALCMHSQMWSRTHRAALESLLSFIHPYGFAVVRSLAPHCHSA
jgi:hypothetical protein